MIICIYGAASPRIDEKYTKATEKLGAEMALKGHKMVFGGGGVGNMGSAAKGMRDNGGYIISVLPKFFHDQGVEELYEDPDELIYTETLSERKAIMEGMADAFIITPGGIGTFDEFFETLTLKQLGKHSKPIVLYNVDGYYEPIMAALNKSYDEKFLRYKPEDICGLFDDPKEILDYLDKQLG